MKLVSNSLELVQAGFRLVQTGFTLRTGSGSLQETALRSSKGLGRVIQACRDGKDNLPLRAVLFGNLYLGFMQTGSGLKLVHPKSEPIWTQFSTTPEPQQQGGVERHEAPRIVASKSRRGWKPNQASLQRQEPPHLPRQTSVLAKAAKPNARPQRASQRVEGTCHAKQPQRPKQPGALKPLSATAS